MNRKNMKRNKTHKGKWTESDEQKLIHLRRDGISNIEIAAQLKRTPASVSMRCTKLRRRGIDIAKRHSGTGPPFGNEFRKGTGNHESDMERLNAMQYKPDLSINPNPSSYFPHPLKVDDTLSELEERVSTLEPLVEVCKDELSKARIKLLALEDYSAQLERENKALIKALRVTNSLVDVYTKRDED